MSDHYMPGLGRELNGILESSAEIEELNKDFRNNEFVATNGKALSISVSIAVLLSAIAGLVLVFCAGNLAAGICFLAMGGCGALSLPTLFSWRCTVNKEFLLEEYFVLCFKCKKKILWSDVKYKKVVCGNNKKIVLYSQSRKRLISFDGMTVGFHQIVKTVKRKGIAPIKKKYTKRSR